MANAPPSIDPSDLDTLTGTMRSVFRKFIMGMDGCLPVRVIAYDRDTNRAQVQPLIQLLDTSNQTYSRAQIASVPCLNIGGGGFALSFDYVPGDIGWLIANDRDISLFLQAYGEARPQTMRIKNFADGWFIGDGSRNLVIAEEDAESCTLQSLDGTIKITLNSDNGITISAPEKPVTIITNEADITAPKVRITASTNAIVTTPLLAVSGNITAGGTITPLTPPPPP
jgi:hypothetical protein